MTGKSPHIATSFTYFASNFHENYISYRRNLQSEGKQPDLIKIARLNCAKVHKDRQLRSLTLRSRRKNEESLREITSPTVHRLKYSSNVPEVLSTYSAKLLSFQERTCSNSHASLRFIDAIPWIYSCWTGLILKVVPKWYFTDEI